MNSDNENDAINLQARFYARNNTRGNSYFLKCVTFGTRFTLDQLVNQSNPKQIIFLNAWVDIE